MGVSTKGNGLPAASLRPFFNPLFGIAVGCWCDATTPLEEAMRIFSVASRLEGPSSSCTFDLLDVDLIKSRFDEQVADCDRPWGNPLDESFLDDLCLSLDGLAVDPTKIRVKPGKVKIPELAWIKARTREPVARGKLIRVTLQEDGNRGFYVQLEYEVP